MAASQPDTGVEGVWDAAFPQATTSHPALGMQERMGVIDRVANGGRAWRRATFQCLGLLGCSLLIHAYAFTRPMERFATVELDTCGGESRVVGPLPTRLTFRQVNIDYILERFVQDMRGISSDIESTKAQWRRLREQVTPAGAQLLNQTEAELQPLQHKGAVVVKVIRIQLRDGTRYDVRWQETRYNANGELAGPPTQWGGLFTFTWDTPRRGAPLGMLFTLWEWRQER